MQAIIGIDIGNSYSKIDFNHQHQLLFSNLSLANQQLSLDHNLLSELAKYNSYFLSISSVITEDSCQHLIAKIIALLQLNAVSIKIWRTSEILQLTPLKNAAKLHHLGSDRALRIYYLMQQPQGSAKISCGCGSAMTVEVIHNNWLCESLILPGLKMQLDSLYNSTAGLPLIDPESMLIEMENSLKFSTHASIVNGIFKSYQGLIERLIAEYKPNHLILSGGYAEIIKKKAYSQQQNVYYKRSLEAQILVDIATQVQAGALSHLKCNNY